MASTETKAPAPAGARSMPESETIMETINDTTPTDNATDNAGDMFADYSREALISMLTRSTERIESMRVQVASLSAQVEGSDPRLTEFWAQAKRVADNAGFCTEFDRIAQALGGPVRQLDWSGEVDVTFTLTVSVPVGGTATPEEVENHTMDYDVDSYNVLEAIKSVVENMTWRELESEGYETQDHSLEVTDTEPHED
jgi:hypothetical protein